MYLKYYIKQIYIKEINDIKSLYFLCENIFSSSYCLNRKIYIYECNINQEFIDIFCKNISYKSILKNFIIRM